MYSIEKAKEALKLLKALKTSDIKAIDCDNAFYETIKRVAAEHNITSDSYLLAAVSCLQIYIEEMEK